MEKYIFKLINITRKNETKHQKSEWQDDLYSYPSFMMIGHSAEIYINNGKVLRTSPVIKFELHGDYMIIETNNTIYEFRK